MEEQVEQQEKKLDNTRTRRIVYISIILVFVFLIVWISGIAGKVLSIMMGL